VVKASVAVPAFVVAAAAAVKSTIWMVILSLCGDASQAKEKEAVQTFESPHHNSRLFVATRVRMSNDVCNRD
jgi:hypothetical protein